MKGIRYSTYAGSCCFSLVFLAALGGLAARAGGAKISIGAIRVTFWGVLALTLTAAVGRLFGVAV